MIMENYNTTYDMHDKIHELQITNKKGGIQKSWYSYTLNISRLTYILFH